MNEADKAVHFEELGGSLLQATVARYWSAERGRFEANLPWQGEENAVRLCDRSLATSILMRMSGGSTDAALKALVDCPPGDGAVVSGKCVLALLGAGGIGPHRCDCERVARTMGDDAVGCTDNSLQENWMANADSTKSWSHCPVMPAYALFMDIAGIRPTSPGFATCTIRPQLADLGKLELTAQTARGPIPFSAIPKNGGHRVAHDRVARGVRGRTPVEPGGQA